MHTVLTSPSDAISRGDDAIHADAAMAEQSILQRFPGADWVAINRTIQRKRLYNRAVTVAHWEVHFSVGNTDYFGSAAILDAAMAEAFQSSATNQTVAA
jgi:hypothetical protein